MATSKEDMQKEDFTFRKFKEGNSNWDSFTDLIFKEDTSHKCPTYVHRTPPCQGSCPSGEDIRGWLDIVRGIETPPEGVSMQEYAFRRSTDANPFPSMMGRVCPAPCETGCNRNDVEEFVGINCIRRWSLTGVGPSYNTCVQLDNQTTITQYILYIDGNGITDNQTGRREGTIRTNRERHGTKDFIYASCL